MAIISFYFTNSICDLWPVEGIARYSERALLRVWKAERFSWWFSGLLHRYPHQSRFDLKMQQADIAFLRDNAAQQCAFAENYVGLPY